MKHVDFAQSPFLTIWETTQACKLKCLHCRADAQVHELPGTLNTEEGKNLLTQIQEMGCPIIVFTGGDPLERRDLDELISFAKSLGLRTATIPAATSNLTRHRLEQLKEAGIDQIAFSLDFPAARDHDSFRGSPGAFDKTIEACGWVRELQIPLQINTVISKQSFPHLQEMAHFVETLGIAFWEVFFLIPMGRGSHFEELSPQLCEDAFEILYELHQRSSFVLKVTEAPHYRRYVIQREGLASGLPEKLKRSEGPGGGMGLSSKTVNSGKGFMFVSYNGDIFPSGFLPIKTGNVRSDNLISIYRDHSLFVDLRDPQKLLGKCKRCEFSSTCGGSRSRAFAVTKNAFASEPWCLHLPG